MKAVVFDQPGDESVLRMDSVPAPKLGPRDLRIRVKSTAVNRADLVQRMGLYPPPPGASEILGLECAGEVTEVGEDVVGFRFGDRVMALLAGGGYAEEAVVHAGSVLHIPEGFSFEEAGAFPEVYLTAYLNLFLLGGAGPRDWVLVHGGGSGVGTAAIRLCKQSGVRVIVTAGSDSKCERCLALGADRAINYKQGDFAATVRETTGGRGVRVVLDCVGGAYLDQNLRCLALEGRLVVIGIIGGAQGEANLGLMLVKRLQILGSTLRSRSADEKGAIVRRFREDFSRALESGKLRPVIHTTFPLEEVAEAHRLVQSSAHFGKVALRVAG